MREVKDKYFLEFTRAELIDIDTAIDVFIARSGNSEKEVIRETAERLRVLQHELYKVIFD